MIGEVGQGWIKKKKEKNGKRETIGEVLLEIQVKGLNFKGEKKTSEGWN